MSTIQLHTFSCGSISSVMLDFSALMFVILSNRNLFVNRMGVSLMVICVSETGVAFAYVGAVADVDADTVFFDVFFPVDDDAPP